VTLLNEKLYVDGFGERGPWDTESLAFQDESVVEVLVTRVGHLKVVTAEELLAVLRETQKSLPAVRVWTSEGLEGVARGLWEKARIPYPIEGFGGNFETSKPRDCRGELSENRGAPSGIRTRVTGLKGRCPWPG
jgi:hypothetical protein